MVITWPCLWLLLWLTASDLLCKNNEILGDFGITTLGDNDGFYIDGQDGGDEGINYVKTCAVRFLMKSLLLP